MKNLEADSLFLDVGLSVRDVRVRLHVRTRSAASYPDPNPSFDRHRDCAEGAGGGLWCFDAGDETLEAKETVRAKTPRFGSNEDIHLHVTPVSVNTSGETRDSCRKAPHWSRERQARCTCREW